MYGNHLDFTRFRILKTNYFLQKNFFQPPGICIWRVFLPKQEIIYSYTNNTRGLGGENFALTVKNSNRQENITATSSFDCYQSIRKREKEDEYCCGLKSCFVCLQFVPAQISELDLP